MGHGGSRRVCGAGLGLCGPGRARTQQLQLGDPWMRAVPSPKVKVGGRELSTPCHKDEGDVGNVGA